MTKKSLIIIALVLLALVSPSVARAECMADGAVDTELTSVTLSVSGAKVSVGHAAGQTLEVYSLTGQKVYAVRLEGDTATVSLASLPGGMYIVRVGSVARKVSLRA